MWTEPTVCLITGASAGIGKALAVEVAKRLHTESAVILLSSRTKAKLNDVHQDIKAVNPKVKIGLLEWNLVSPADVAFYEDQLRSALKEQGVEPLFHNAICFHSAASIGDMSQKVVEWTQPEKLQQELNINVISFLMINNAFWSVFKDCKSKLAVNFTAGSAVTPFPSFGMTAMAKASRQIVLSVLAAESLEIKVLHFNPGLADTESLRVIRDKAHDESIRNWMVDAYKDGVMSVSYIANFLLNAIQEDKFKSGDVIVCAQK